MLQNKALQSWLGSWKKVLDKLNKNQRLRDAQTNSNSLMFCMCACMCVWVGGCVHAQNPRSYLAALAVLLSNRSRDQKRVKKISLISPSNSHFTKLSTLACRFHFQMGPQICDSVSAQSNLTGETCIHRCARGKSDKKCSLIHSLQSLSNELMMNGL